MSKQNKRTISEKMTELDKLIAWFDSEDFSVEEAIDRYKAAELLAGDIEADLDTIKQEIDVVKKRFD